jgi:predicted alpha-1,6-mannanase (GH76 family)
VPSAASVVASSAYERFLAAYWNSSTHTFYARSDHAFRPVHGSTADFWWTAELWETVMDAYEQSHRPADRALIDAVYDGFVKRFPTFASDFNDDRGWWALAATRAWSLTKETRFLARAESLFAGVWSSWDGTYGGGVWWRRSVHGEKNAATNGVAAMTAAALYQATHDTIYRTRAAQLFGWLDRTLRRGTEIEDHIEGASNVVTWQFTYDYGVYIGSAAALRTATGSASYLSAAVSAADHAIASLTTTSVLRDEGTGDGGGFKGVLVRNLARLATVARTSTYTSFLERNAAAATRARRSDGLNGSSWTHVPTASAIESLTDSSAVTLYEIVATRR